MADESVIRLPNFRHKKTNEIAEPINIEDVVPMPAPTSPSTGINRKFSTALIASVITPMQREAPGFPLAEIIVVATDRMWFQCPHPPVQAPGSTGNSAPHLSQA